MINLLSTERKEALKAARVNVILSRYIGIIALAAIFIVGVLYVAYTILQQADETIQARIDTSTLEIAQKNAPAGPAPDTSANDAIISQATSALDQRVAYGPVLTGIAEVLPAGTVLAGLELTPTSFEATSTLTVYAIDEATAQGLQQVLQGSAVFTQVTQDSVAATGGIDEYPAVATFTVTLSRGAN